MTKHSILSLIAAAAIAATAAPLGAQEAVEEEELEAARAELEEAREALEEAARDVARLSAQVGGAAARSIGIVTNPAVLGVNVTDDEEGARVIAVTPDSPAEASGVATGDIIVALDGAELEGDSPAHLLVAQAMRDVAPGEPVLLTIVRDGDEEEIEVVAGSSRAIAIGSAFGDRDFVPGNLRRLRDDIGDRVRSFGGRRIDMELVELTPELGAYFGTETGILVISAPSEEPLQGLMDGDVILEIGGRTPNDTGHARRILASFESGETLELEIMRNQRRETLEVEFP